MAGDRVLGFRPIFGRFLGPTACPYPWAPSPNTSAHSITLPLTWGLGVWVIGVPQGFLMYNLDNLTYNIFMARTCRALGVARLMASRRECVLLTSTLVPVPTSKG
ncbi:hypothetical protein ATANTOWER_001475 [Ataeniobius toweri]|uniref:Uncharacterized protein n=1 Tax=Ataeniobius toweri TaxID=208326 RepID=A0ABU7C501_9TELE|nr:hypothetical protein [Ataeniobius toweri]